MGEVILGGEAVKAGVVTRHELARWYTTIYRGVFVRKGVEVSLRDRAVAAWLATGRKGVISGLTAGALHGSAWIDPALPIEVSGVKCLPQDGLLARTEPIAADEIVCVAGLPVTTRARTAFDLGRHLDRPEALARLDALMWHQPFDVDEVVALADRRPRAPGIRQLRQLLPLVDGGAASPRQSRMRLWLLDCGFPRPQTQVPVVSGSEPVAFLDMGWPEFKVAVDFGDGGIALRREIDELGWIVVQVVAEERPEAWLARVEAVLHERGCRLEFNELHRFTRTFAA